MVPVELREIYETYARYLGQAQKKSSIFAGLFGQGSMGDARSDSCNQIFYENTGRWVEEFSTSGPGDEQLYEVCRFILEAAKLSQGKATYWYHLVAQGHVKILIPMLSEESRSRLSEQYVNWYPKKGQLPLQREICQLLSKRS